MDNRVHIAVLFLLGFINLVESDNTMHLSVVACGDRLEETLMMVKSTYLFSQKPMHYHILADDELRPLFQNQLITWPEFIRRKFTFSLYPITYPEGESEVKWKKVYKPCATQRLFIPYVLEQFQVDVPRLIYVDTDILFFKPLDDVWAQFNDFDTAHIAALIPDAEVPAMGWYNRFAKHPYYGEMGLNSGVMLMDVHRMRAANWVKCMIHYYDIYRYNITWGDQDLINIFFHNYPEKLRVLPCEWNYRPHHCWNGSVCKTAETKGIFLVHGNSGYFHNNKQPTFKAIYKAIKDYTFGQDLEKHLLHPLLVALKQTESTYCGKTSKFLVKELQRQIGLVKERGQSEGHLEINKKGNHINRKSENKNVVEHASEWSEGSILNTGDNAHEDL